MRNTGIRRGKVWQRGRELVTRKQKYRSYHNRRSGGGGRRVIAEPSGLCDARGDAIKMVCKKRVGWGWCFS